MSGFILNNEFVDIINIKLTRFFYDVKNGLRNLWKWRSVVWNDRPWDYVYIFKALRFKLDETQRCIDGTFVGADEEAAKIRSLMEAIDRILEDDYVSEEYKEDYTYHVSENDKSYKISTKEAYASCMDVYFLLCKWPKRPVPIRVCHKKSHIH